MLVFSYVSYSTVDIKWMKDMDINVYKVYFFSDFTFTRYICIDER